MKNTHLAVAFALASFSAAFAGRSLAQKTLLTVNGDSGGDTFGQVVDMLGDVNGDGFADFIVGAWRDDPAGKTDAGTVRLCSGKDGSTLLTVPGDLPGDHMGFGSSGAGDVNGDGFPDFIAAADEADQPGLANVGTAKVISGKDGAQLRFLVGVHAGDFFGWSSAAAGDVDNDGFDDVILGALNGDGPVINSTGTATVISGASGLVIWTEAGDSSGDQLGYSVAGVGDVNADGFGDFLAGAPGDDNTGGASGSARLYSGKDGSTLKTFNGDNAGDGFGRSVSGLGDVNLDGVPDFVVGAIFDDNNGTDSGSARVFSGATLLALQTVNGNSSSDRYGTWVRNAGDVDGDGFPDIAVGASNDSLNGAGAGSLTLVSGRTFGVIQTFHGDSPGDALGTSVAGGFDVDGDGLADAIAGAPGDDNVGSGSGSARVYSAVVVGATSFGTGTPGCTGTQHLTANSLPKIGNATFGLVVDNSPPSALGLGLVGNVQNLAGSDPLGFGALFHIDLFASTTLLGFDVFGDALGVGTATIPIPNDPAVVGATFYFQTISVWPAPCGLGPFNVSTSTGMKAVLLP